MLMFAGQMGCEAVNLGLKRLIKEERPPRRFWFLFPSHIESVRALGRHESKI